MLKVTGAGRLTRDPELRQLPGARRTSYRGVGRIEFLAAPRAAERTAEPRVDTAEPGDDIAV